ncbi:MAG: hypothetical protein PVF51_00915, partial [Nitrospirota bacterium]
GIGATTADAIRWAVREEAARYRASDKVAGWDGAHRMPHDPAPRYAPETATPWRIPYGRGDDDDARLSR